MIERNQGVELKRDFCDVVLCEEQPFRLCGVTDPPLVVDSLGGVFPVQAAQCVNDEPEVQRSKCLRELSGAQAPIDKNLRMRLREAPG